MNERLIQFLAAENISQAQFADSINVARAGISHIVAGRNKPSTDFIISTMNRYPTLNIEWLLTGKGKMYKSGNVAVNEVNNEKMESNPLNGGENSSINLFDDGSDGEIYGSESVAMENQASRTSSQPADRPASQPATLPYGTTLTVDQSVDQPSAGHIMPQNAFRTATNKPNVTKIIVFFDDGTFQECK